MSDEMILRVWRGWTRTEDADAYAAYVAATGLTDYQATPGNLGAYLASKEDEERTEFMTVSFWADQSSIEAFAGAPIDKAVFYAEDDRFLIDRETTVNHYRLRCPSPWPPTGESGDTPENQDHSTDKRSDLRTADGQVLQMRLVVEANDLPSAVDFYRNQLGLTEELDLESDNGARVVILDAGRATLELVNPAQRALIDELEVGRQVSREIRVAFQVEDARAATRRLVDAGAPLIAEPVETPWRSLNSRLEGQAGLQLTVFEELGDDTTVSLRGLRPGDLGWVVERHGALYAEEYGWDLDFEALVAVIVGRYQQHLEPEREKAWIVEVGGIRAGCVFCTVKDESTAQLRMLLVEPWARGRGLGTLLVETCISFARSAGYEAMILWTNDVLADARRLYEKAGFTLESETLHDSFGHNLVGQIWRFEL